MFSYVLRRNVNSRTYMFYVDHYELVHDILHVAMVLMMGPVAVVVVHLHKV